MDLYSYVNTGDPLPRFRATTLEGIEVDTGLRNDRFLWLYFFIIKCPFCRDSMQFLEEELSKTESLPFDFLAIGRDHTAEELDEFRMRKGYTFPMAPDPGRKIFSLFATGKVPRSYLAGADGRILISSRGYNAAEYRNIMDLAIASDPY